MFHWCLLQAGSAPRPHPLLSVKSQIRFYSSSCRTSWSPRPYTPPGRQWADLDFVERTECFPTLCCVHQCSSPFFSPAPAPVSLSASHHLLCPKPQGLQPAAVPSFSCILTILQQICISVPDHRPAISMSEKPYLLCSVFMVSGVPSKGHLPRVASLTSLRHSPSLCAHCTIIFLLILLLVSFYWNMSFHVKVLLPHGPISSAWNSMGTVGT